MIRCLLFAAAVLLPPLAPLLAQDQSVNPGINKSYENPDVDKFVERFERDGRDAYDHRQEILKELKLTPGMALADIGAGTGLFTRLFSEKVGPQGKVYAVDISDEFIKHILQDARQEKRGNVTGVVCQPDSAELPPNSIDLAFICDTYHHFEYPQKTMRSIHRALKPGGQVVLIDFVRIEGVSSDWILGHVRAGQEVFTREIESAGFQQVESKPKLLRESYFVRFKKVAAASGE